MGLEYNYLGKNERGWGVKDKSTFLWKDAKEISGCFRRENPVAGTE